MSVSVINSFGNLEEELEKAKTNLKGLNDNIRRIIGRDPENRLISNSSICFAFYRFYSAIFILFSNLCRGDRKRPAGNFENPARRIDRPRYVPSDAVSAPQSKRRQIENPSSTTKSVFSRLSGPPNRDDDYAKPKIHSRVIKEQPSKQDIVAAQGADAQSRARNRRMFGSLMGTLQKFCQEESRLKPKEEKKAQIEKKLEEQAKKERENMKKEKECLFSDRKRKQMEIKAIELKMQKMKELSNWENSVQPLSNFIRTKTKPYLYYLPKVMNKKAEEKLQSSKENVHKMIEKKRLDVAEEISSIESRFNCDEEEKSIPSKHDREGNGANENDEIDDNDNDDNHSPDDNSDIENFNQNRKLSNSSVVKVKTETNSEDHVTVKKEKSDDERKQDKKLSEKAEETPDSNTPEKMVTNEDEIIENSNINEYELHCV